MPRPLRTPEPKGACSKTGVGILLRSRFSGMAQRQPRPNGRWVIAKMFQMQFNSVAASEAGDYFQVLFEEDVDNPEARYFLIQCQFEFPDDGEFYIESDDTRLCGHFEIKTATLSRESLRLEIPSTKWKIIHVKFQRDDAAYEELQRVLETMFEDKLQHAH